MFYVYPWVTSISPLDQVEELVGVIRSDWSSASEFCSNRLGSEEQLEASRLDIYFVANPADVVEGDEFTFTITATV